VFCIGIRTGYRFTRPWIRIQEGQKGLQKGINEEVSCFEELDIISRGKAFPAAWKFFKIASFLMRIRIHRL